MVNFKKQAYDKIYYQKNKTRKDAINKIWQKNHFEQYRKLRTKGMKRYRDRLKLAAFIHYSSNPPKCACCNDYHLEFLALDHKNGGGNKHRKMIPHTGSYIYLWVKRNNYPPLFQVLCHNCNFAKSAYKVCPHQLTNL